MKKSSRSVKYVNLVTKKPLVFYGVLVVGVALFLFLTLTTHIDTDEGSQTLFHIIFLRAGRGL